jgi:hypothetical protein
MSWLESVAVFEAAELNEERRSEARLRVVTTIGIRHLEDSATEKATLIDLSRDGLCFTVRSNAFQVGMELGIVLPRADSESIGEVVRTQRLPNGRLAVGVRIRSW